MNNTDILEAKAKLRLKIKGCEKCGLHKTCRKPVPIHGATPANLLVVGEAPGQHEDEQGKPFVGYSGQLLRRVLRQVFGQRWEWEVAFMNVVCCRPPQNRTPAPDEIWKCEGNRRLQIAMANPRVILLCGSTALTQFRGDLQVSKDRGRPFEVDEKQVAIPTWHPAFVVRKKHAEEDFISDVVQARLRVHEDMYGDWPDDCRLCGKEVESYDPQGVAYCKHHKGYCRDRREDKKAVQERLELEV